MIDRLQPTAPSFRHALGRFAARRFRDAAYGAAFATVFLAAQSPLNALVVNDIRVLSQLGEPFLAEIAVTPAAGELLSSGCFSTRSANGDLPAPRNLRLSLTRRLDSAVLTLRGAAVREPMTEFVLQIRCPGVPTMLRTYLVMVDPPTVREPAPVALTRIEAPRAATPRPLDLRTPRRGPSRTQAGTIEPGSRYTVRAGDMLSTIAARVAGRPDWSVWPIAQGIFAANPGAFLLGNPNTLAEGATLYIPRLEELDLRDAGPATLGGPVPEPAARTEVARAVVPRVIEAPAAAVPAGPVAAPLARTERQAAVRDVVAPASAVKPTVATALAAALPTLQLTTALFDESGMKLRLRREGVSLRPVDSRPEPTAAAAPRAPAPESVPERPDTAATSGRVALPAPQTPPARSFGWVGWLLGLLVGFLAGALAAAGWLRRRRDQEEPPPATAPVKATPAPMIGAVAPASTTPRRDEIYAEPVDEVAAADPFEQTGEFAVDSGELTPIDLELFSEEPAAVGEPQTLEMPTIDESLDLELPGSDATAITGQQEVDFDLLERAYSEDYETQFPSAEHQPTAEMPLLDEEDIDEPEADERYYHLENRDPADDAPLPIELGEDEMPGDDLGDEGNVVHFPKSSSSG